MNLTSQDYPFYANGTTVVSSRGIIVCGTFDLQLAQDITAALNEKYQPAAAPQNNRITVLNGVPL